MYRKDSLIQAQQLEDETDDDNQADDIDDHVHFLTLYNSKKILRLKKY